MLAGYRAFGQPRWNLVWRTLPSTGAAAAGEGLPHAPLKALVTA